jgi:hypothetical protein
MELTTIIVHQDIIPAFTGIHHFMILSTGILTDYGLMGLHSIMAPSVILITITYITADMVTEGLVTGMAFITADTPGQDLLEIYAIMTAIER